MRSGARNFTACLRVDLFGERHQTDRREERKKLTGRFIRTEPRCASCCRPGLAEAGRQGGRLTMRGGDGCCFWRRRRAGAGPRGVSPQRINPGSVHGAGDPGRSELRAHPGPAY